MTEPHLEWHLGTVLPLSGGDAGVEQTINGMRALVDETLRDERFIRFAIDLVRTVRAFDDYTEAETLYNWVRANIRFTKDPVNKEKLYPPLELLKIRAGDCDDIAMLLAALLMAIGYPARFVTVATPNAPEQFSHVYVEGEIPPGSGQWVPMDAARFDSQFGVPPPVVTRSRWWSVSDQSQGDLSGTKIYAHSGSTINVHLGDYPRYRSIAMSGLGSYGRVRTMGQEASSPAETIAAIEQGTAGIIRAASGQPASPYDWSAYGPWASFQTQYSPYGVPAGYATQQPGAGLQVTGSSNWLLIALVVGGVLVLGSRR